MRIFEPDPRRNITVVYLDDIHAKVNVWWLDNLMEIQQPRYMGGKQRFTLDEYDQFEGNLKEFVLAKRLTIEP